jgi:hypothetical protein
MKMSKRQPIISERKMVIQTDYEFTLPKGYIDENGNLHRNGTMRLATAADEIVPLKDTRVRNNPAYLTIIVLSRVITQLGNLPTVSTKTIEGLFASDLAYLQALYNKINGEGKSSVNIKCPNCKKDFQADIDSAGE